MTTDDRTALATPATKAGRAYVEWDDHAVEGGAMERITGKRHWTTTDAILAIEAEARAQGALHEMLAAEGDIERAEARARARALNELNDDHPNCHGYCDCYYRGRDAERNADDDH